MQRVGDASLNVRRRGLKVSILNAWVKRRGGFRRNECGFSECGQRKVSLRNRGSSVDAKERQAVRKRRKMISLAIVVTLALREVSAQTV